MSQSNPPDVGALLQGAQDDGLLSAAAANALNIPDLGAQIQAGLGVNCDDVAASEVVLVTLDIDDSGSIRFGSNTQLVRDGHNLALDSLAATKQKDQILMHTRYINGTVLNPYRPLDQVVRMDQSNFDPGGGTPLFDDAVVALGTVMTKAQDFADNGVPVRTITLFATDGGDGSLRMTAKDVRLIVEDMLRAENHIVAGMGIDDGHTDFRQVFADMGIPDEWILTPNNTPGEIRQAFQVFSQSAVRASQSAGNFSQTSMGGFDTP